MTRLLFAFILAPILLALVASSVKRDVAPVDVSALDLELVDPDAEAELIVWRDLMPIEEIEALRRLNEGEADPSLMGMFTGHSPFIDQVGTFNVVEDLDGVIARMPGFLLPLDSAEFGTASEFLLLPTHGACVHYPPPPPNQIVYLRSPVPIQYRSHWDPVWVEGRLSVERIDSSLAASAYSMVARSVEPLREGR